MSNVKWVDKHIEITDLPKKFKKITGTRFGAVLGMNKWNTPFQAWCEITKTYEKPFEDSKYTIAGKTIEPKQAKYLEDCYAMELKSPTDIYGKDYFKKTYGDFFSNEPIFGGMWDYLCMENGELDSVIEFKTTSRAEDWNGDIPIYYAVQAALYAYLKGTDNVIMGCSFLEEKDYENPDAFVPSASNTILIPFKISEYLPNFENYLKQAVDFWENNVLKGISPDYDEVKDKEYLDALRKATVNPTTTLEDLAKEYESCLEEIAKVEKYVERADEIKNQIKEILNSNIGEGQTKAEYTSSSYVYSLSKSVTSRVDTTQLKKDGLYDHYVKSSETIKLSVKSNKEVNE